MKDIAKRFNDYLDESIKKIKEQLGLYFNKDFQIQNDLLRRIKAYERIKAVLSINDDELSVKGTVINNFSGICYILSYSDFNIYEQIDIIMYIIGRNFKIGILHTERPALDLHSVKNYDFKYTNYDELLEMMHIDSCYTFLNTPDEELSEIDRLKKEEIKNILFTYTEDHTYLKDIHKRIKEHYIDKYPNLDQEDIDIFISALRGLSVNEEALIEFRGILEETINDKVVSPEVSGSVSKFLNDIVNYCQKTENNYVNFKDKKDYDIKLQNASKIYSWLIYKTAAHMNKTILIDFDSLEEILLSNKLTDEDIANIIFYVIECNIENGILNENYAFVNDYNRYRDTQIFLQTSTDISAGLIYPNQYSYLYRINAMNISDASVLTNVVGNISLAHFEKIRNAHKIVFNSFLIKKDSYNSKDIDEIIKALSLLNLSKKILNMIKKSLTRKMVIRDKINKSDDDVPNIKSKTSRVVINPVLDRKLEYEKAKIYDELMTYFDFNKMKCIKYLSLNDTIYCISLLRKIRFNDDRIREFILKAEDYCEKHKRNPIIRFFELLDKIEYYSDNEELQDMVLELKSAFKEALENDDDFYKEYLDMLIDNALKILPDNFEYEMVLADKYLIRG